MVFDHIDNAIRFQGLGPGFNEAMEFLRTHDLASIECGRHDILGDALFAIVQDYTTKPIEEGFWEAHRRYIDVQYVVNGQELIGFSPISRMKFVSHDAARDLSVFEGEGDFATMQAGNFMVLWPDDAHMPGLQVSGPEMVRKIVFKIAA